MKTLCNNYSINGNAITLSGANVPVSQILLIANQTRGSFLYQIGGTPPSTYVQGTDSIFTLAATGALSGTDKLAIYYDNGINPVNAPAVVGISGTAQTTFSPDSPLPQGTNTIGITNPATGNVLFSGVSVGTGTTLIFPANTAKKMFAFQNLSTSETVYLSSLDPATPTNSAAFQPGLGYEFPVIPQNAVYAIATASGVPGVIWYS
jgi:hypothetical protein